MHSSLRTIVIASRRSRLARIQAQTVGQMITQADPSVAVEYRWIESQGDQLAHTSLADVGGKGLFAHAVEQTLLSKEADLAVHSLKDLPANEPTDQLIIAAVLPRADVRDCLISPVATTLQQLPQGATLGTASPRRAAQALRLRPDLRIELIRGNIETRLRKVQTQGRYDATLLAVAGLQRAGLEEHAVNQIDPSIMLPAAGQGALAVQCRADDQDTRTRCAPLNDAPTATAVHAERRIVAAMNGDCHSPIAVLIEPTDNNTATQFEIRARVLSLDGKTCLTAEQNAKAEQLDHTTEQVISRLRQDGCDELLRTPAEPR